MKSNLTDGEGLIYEFFLNLPFGETMAEQHAQTTDYVNRWKFTRHELDRETGLYYAGARYYDPKVSVFLSVDVLMEAQPDKTPYHYVSNNPINRIDPTGMLDNPIYDIDGNFLGTDDRGLQGDAIVMDKNDFKQGMSHKDALRKGTTLSGACKGGCITNDVFNKINEHYLNLPNRPDWDGYLTLKEANEWYRTGEGQPLFVDASKIDLSPVKKSDFSEIGDSFYKNFAFTSNTKTGLVYGNIKLTLIDDKGTIKLGGKNGFLDKYDFDYKGGVKNIPRNIATWIGEKIAGKGAGYTIFNYGTGKAK